MQRTTSTASLANKALLVSLNIGFWEASKLDRQLSRETDAAHNAKEGTVRVTKRIIAKEAFAELRTLATQARDYHNRMTLAWAKGIGLLPSVKYTEYRRIESDLHMKYDDAADRLEAVYPDLVEDARQAMNGLFKEADYPKSIRKLYHFHVQVLPVPQSGDFRVDLMDEDIAAIKEALERDNKEANKRMVAEMWSRLTEPLDRMIEKLGDEDSRFRDSLVDNLKKVVEELSCLNVVDDVAITTACTTIKEKLTKYSADTLRINPVVRADVAKEAKKLKDTADDIISKMGGFMLQ